jgi:hypothetical protein
MSKHRARVSIQGPPVGSLRRRHSCLRRTCVGGLGCLFLILLTLTAVLFFLAGPKETSLDALPSSVYDAVPIYDTENTSSVLLVPGSQRNRIVEALAYLPKALLAPFIALSPDRVHDLDDTTSRWDAVRVFVSESVGDHRDKYHITWKNLAAQPSFIYTYYQDELTQRGFEIGTSTSFTQATLLEFVHRRKNIEGSVMIRDLPSTNGTDSVKLILFVE